MYQNRIQKLLYREYVELAEMVLIESPFAETTRDGIGKRQIYMGVTPTKLVFAADIVKPSTDVDVVFSKNQCPDAEIENFELLSVYAIETVNLSIFRKNRRKTIKAQLCNDQVKYFELGGCENKLTVWTLWCERIQFLNAEEISSCLSDDSSILVPLVRSITCFSYSWGIRNDRNRKKIEQNRSNSSLRLKREYRRIPIAAACNYSFI